MDLMGLLKDSEHSEGFFIYKLDFEGFLMNFMGFLKDSED